MHEDSLLSLELTVLFFQIMQLFSLGLIRMAMDGSPMMTSDGQLIETYSNLDLFSYARAWTGLRETDVRGNNDGNNFRLDPMAVS